MLLSTPQENSAGHTSHSTINTSPSDTLGLLTVAVAAAPAFDSLLHFKSGCRKLLCCEPAVWYSHLAC
jgi:hypothetical protein